MLKTLRRLPDMPIVHLLIIAAVCVIIYSNSFKAPFMFDDYTNIIEKSVIKDIGQYKDSYSLISPKANRRFVGVLTFALNYKLNGMDVAGYHVFNLIVHALSALAVYWLVMLIFRTPFFESFDPFFGRGLAALFTALLFAVHPIQTSAVTYIVQRYTSLATLLCLVSLLAYVKSRLKLSSPVCYGLYAVSIIAAVAAMRTKEIAFTLPVIAVLFEFLFLDGRLKKRILYLIPLVSTMLIIPISILANKAPDAANALAIALNPKLIDSSMKLASVTDITRTEYLFTELRVIVTYLRLLFVPVSLNLDYDYPVFRSFFKAGVMLSFLVVALLFASALYMLFKSFRAYRCPARLYCFGMLWFFIALSVESSVIPIKDVINEYRLYYPSVGFFIAVIAVVVWIVQKWGRPAKVYAISVLSLIIVVFSAMTVLRNEVWADRVRLWEDTVRKSPNKARPHYNLGYDYIRQGRVVDASREFQTAITLKPDFADAYNNLGDIYAAQGRMDEAIDAFKKAVQSDPNFAVAYNNLGTIYDERGQFEEAAADYRMAIRLQPDYIDARLNLGNLLIKAKQFNEAAAEFQGVLHLAPYNDEAAQKLRALHR
ncbi:tetratricopeptide repeat protein [Candidatus Magnetominusculus dajiuhuensis]|uniref:tetratricopeptide repeat protein n=1 Tax=Candidatus Magnetominusculus dajiuhuensis TaxID=3137712 RepID=UPI003B438205